MTPNEKGEQMKLECDTLFLLFIVPPWLAGVVLAKGLWPTIIAIFFPPYARYLVVERALMAIGWSGV